MLKRFQKWKLLYSTLKYTFRSLANRAVIRSARSRHTDWYFPLFTSARLVQYYPLHSLQSKLIFWSIEARSLTFFHLYPSALLLCYSGHMRSDCTVCQPAVNSRSASVFRDIYSCSVLAPAPSHYKRSRKRVKKLHAVLWMNKQPPRFIE